MMKWIAVWFLVSAGLFNPIAQPDDGCSMNLHLKSRLKAGSGTGFAFLPGTDHWALSGVYGTVTWEGSKRMDDLIPRGNSSEMRYAADGKELWVGPVKVELPTKTLHPIPQLWDENGDGYIQNISFCPDEQHAVVFTRSAQRKSLDADPFAPASNKLLVIDRHSGARTVMLKKQCSPMAEDMPIEIIGDLAVAGHHGLEVWNWKKGAPIFSSKATEGFITLLASDESLGLLVVGLSNGPLEVWDTNTWKKTSTFDPDMDRVQEVEFHPEKSVVAIAGQNGELALANIVPVEIVIVHQQTLKSPATGLAWHPSSGELYVATREEVLIFEAQ